MVFVQRILNMYIPVTLFTSILLLIGSVILFVLMYRKKSWNAFSITLSIINLFLACFMIFNFAYIKLHFLHAEKCVVNYIMNYPTVSGIIAFLIIVIVTYSILFLIDMIVSLALEKCHKKDEMEKA